MSFIAIIHQYCTEYVQINCTVNVFTYSTIHIIQYMIDSSDMPPTQKVEAQRKFPAGNYNIPS